MVERSMPSYPPRSSVLIFVDRQYENWLKQPPGYPVCTDTCKHLTNEIWYLLNLCVRVQSYFVRIQQKYHAYKVFFCTHEIQIYFVSIQQNGLVGLTRTKTWSYSKYIECVQDHLYTSFQYTNVVMHILICLVRVKLFEKNKTWQFEFIRSC
jgi:hypothetical protein